MSHNRSNNGKNIIESLTRHLTDLHVSVEEEEKETASLLTACSSEKYSNTYKETFSRGRNLDARTEDTYYQNKFTYYLSDSDTSIQIIDDTEKKLTSSVLGHISDKITYDSIGGLRSQLELIRETIEFPLRFPDLFRSCGK